VLQPRNNLPGVPACYVSCPTSKLGWATACLVSLGKFLSTRLKVIIPAEPAAMASIDVHDNVWKVEVLDGIRNTISVARGAVLTGRQVGIGDEVG
jgi:hypothetical protein